MSTERRGRASIPSVDVVLRSDGAHDATARHGTRALTEAVRRRLDDVRRTIADAERAPAPEAVLADAVAGLEARRRRGLRPVINATGVVVHTNLGRAPLSEAARRAVAEAAGYVDVEYDLVTGSRGSRTAHVGALAAELCGATAGSAVNNGAGALLLAVAALGGGREVIVSRGELVEIGGSFRLPEIVAAGGARLVEVGTTNRTRLDDYRRAIGPDTGMILKVHRSNFRLVGFTEEASLAELAELGRERGIPVVFDAGSGLIEDDASPDGLDEPEVRGAVATGVDLVLLSGDKLLGGPQAGILVGSDDAVSRCRAAPLARALRIDKLQIAALEATLLAHLREPVPLDVPVVGMLHADLATLRTRAEAIAAGTPSTAVVDLDGVVGGGAAPGFALRSVGVRVDHPHPERVAARLRADDPPIVARIDDGAVVLDVRTIGPADDAKVATALARCVADEPSR